MTQKFTKALNIYEIISIVLVIGGLLLLAMTHKVDFYYYNKELITIMLVLCELIIVSIELFLFYLANIKNKLFTIGFYLIELVFIVLVNIKVPFLGLLFLLIFCAVKNTYRILYVDSICVPNRLYNVCKKYGINIKRDYYRKKNVLVSATINNKSRIKKSKNKANVSESYA